MRKLQNGVTKDMFKKGDLILVAILLIAIILTVVFATRKDDGVAQIYIDGQLKYELDLSANTELSILDGKMTVAIKDGKVFVKDSDCAEQLCVQSSAISSNGGMIVCLPNKVVVKVVAKEVAAIS